MVGGIALIIISIALLVMSIKYKIAKQWNDVYEEVLSIDLRVEALKIYKKKYM